MLKTFIEWMTKLNEESATDSSTSQNAPPSGEDENLPPPPDMMDPNSGGGSPSMGMDNLGSSSPMGESPPDAGGSLSDGEQQQQPSKQSVPIKADNVWDVLKHNFGKKKEKKSDKDNPLEPKDLDKEKPKEKSIYT